MQGACLQLLLISGHVEDTAPVTTKSWPCAFRKENSALIVKAGDSQRTTRKRWYIVKRPLVSYLLSSRNGELTVVRLHSLLLGTLLLLEFGLKVKKTPYRLSFYSVFP